MDEPLMQGDYSADAATRPLLAAIASLILGLAAGPLAVVLGLVFTTLLIKAGVLDANVLRFLGDGLGPNPEEQESLFRVMAGCFFFVQATTAWLGIGGLWLSRNRWANVLGGVGIALATLWALLALCCGFLRFGLVGLAGTVPVVVIWRLSQRH